MSENMNAVLMPKAIDSKSVYDIAMKLRNWAEQNIYDVYNANETLQERYGATMNLNKGPNATEAWNTYCQNQGAIHDLTVLIEMIDKVVHRE